MPDQYSAKVLDHYRHPRNAGKLARSTHKAEEVNLVCGDETVIYLHLVDGIINDASHETRGCAIAVASASMLSETIKGLKLTEIKKITKQILDDLLGVEIAPARESCETLALKALQKLL